MPDSSAIDVHFRYTFWDRVRSGFVMPFQTVPSALWFLAFPAAGLGLLTTHLYYGTPIGLGNGGLILICLFFNLTFLIYYSVKIHFFGKGKDKPFQYQFGDFGVRAYSETEELTQSWSAFTKLKRQGGFLLLFSSPGCAHCLPYRQLLTLEAAEPIVALARAHNVRVYGI